VILELVVKVMNGVKRRENIYRRVGEVDVEICDFGFGAWVGPWVLLEIGTLELS